MTLPPLLNLPNEGSYLNHFNRVYRPRASSIVTFDGIVVKFSRENFYHAFYTESIRGSGVKDTFSFGRAERMDWIRYVLASDSMELYRRVMTSRKIRRISLEASTPYAVVIELRNNNANIAGFVTAYIPGPRALANMKSNPRW